MAETCNVYFAGNDTQRAKSENDIELTSGGGGSSGIIQIGPKLWTPQTGGGSPTPTSHYLAPDDETGQSQGLRAISKRLELDAVFGDMTGIQNGYRTINSAGGWFDVPYFLNRFPIRWVTSVGDELSGDTSGSWTLRAWVVFSASNWPFTNEAARFRVTLYKGIGIAGTVLAQKTFTVGSASLTELSASVSPASATLSGDYITLRYECGYFGSTPH